MGLVDQSAQAFRVPMPLLSLLRDHLLQPSCKKAKTSIGLRAVTHLTLSAVRR